MSPHDKDRKRLLFMKTLTIAAEFGFVVIVPMLVFGYLGKWLESRYHTKLLLIACVAIAISVSSAILYWRILAIYEDLKNL